jgi:hypothetical protein
VDREPIARERRRQQAQEHLEQERELETALRDQLEERVAEAEGPRLDEQVFAQMDPADAKLVRDGFAGIFDDGQPDEQSFWPEDETWLEDEPEDSARVLEEEIARLERELEACRRRQQAYERYLELLGD